MWKKDEQINSFCLSSQPLTNTMECLTHVPLPPHHYSAPALWLWPQSQTQSGSMPLPPGTESRKREWPHFLSSTKSFLWGFWVTSWQPDDSCVSGLGWCRCHCPWQEEPCLWCCMCQCSPGDWGWTEPSVESLLPAAWPRKLKDRHSHSAASLSAACCTSRIGFSVRGEREREYSIRIIPTY